MLGAALAVLLLSGHASAASTAHPVPCLIPPCPTPTPDHHGDPTPTPAVQDTPTASAQALTLALTTPVPTPSLPDAGFAESNMVSQGQNPAAPVLTGGPPPVVANYAAAPGFGDLGFPLLIGFAVLGSGAYALRRRI